MGRSSSSTPKTHKKQLQETCPSTSEISDSLDKKMKSPDSNLSSSDESEPKKRENYFESLPDTLNPPEEEVQFRKKLEQDKSFLERHTKVFKCTKCQSSFDKNLGLNKLRIHPCLGVLLCKDCFDYYGNGDFSLDDDGEDKYCRWCGEGGMLFGCSKCICGFCFECIRKHYGMKYLRRVKKDNNWLCLLCDPKRLWRYRYICSLAIGILNAKNVGNSSSSTAVEGPGIACENRSEDPGKTSVSKIKDSVKSSHADLSESDSSTDLEMWSSKRQSHIKKETSRKRIFSSSSDESENEPPKQKSKKLKLSKKKAEQNRRGKKKSKMGKSKEFGLERLEKVLKLSQQQFTLGANWSSKMLKKFSGPSHITKVENLKEECQRIKWFLSLMSTYLIEFCNSVELVETNLQRDEGLNNINNFHEQMPDPTGFSAVLQFLSFINNQVKTFMGKGLSLPDILQAEMYDDDNVIGLRKNAKSSSCATSNDSVVSNLSKRSRSGTSNEISSPSKANSSTTSNESLQFRPSKAGRNATSTKNVLNSPSKTNRSGTSSERLTSTPSKSNRNSSERNHKVSQQSNEGFEIRADEDESKDEDSFRLIVDEGSEPQDGDDDVSLVNSFGSARSKNDLDYTKQNKDLLQILEILENA